MEWISILTFPDDHRLQDSTVSFPVDLGQLGYTVRIGLFVVSRSTLVPMISDSHSLRTIKERINAFNHPTPFEELRIRKATKARENSNYLLYRS